MRWLVLAALSGCAASVPTSDAGLRLMTFNMANGAGDRYRTREHRAAQAPIVALADIVALQEVDVGAERSGSVNTAAEISGIRCEPAELTKDGVLRCAGDGGVVLFGLGFRGDDRFSVSDGGLPTGIMDADPSLNPTGTDRRSSALYGNALIVRGAAVEAAFVVALPPSTSPPNLDHYVALANGPLDELATHNFAVRNSPAIEPRSVLVVRLTRPGLRPLSILALHLETIDHHPLGDVQLSAVIAIAGAELNHGRRVVILGDFNLPPEETEPLFTDAGFTRAVGDGIDQIWVGDGLSTSEAVQTATDGGSDHLWAPSVLVR